MNFETLKRHTQLCDTNLIIRSMNLETLKRRTQLYESINRKEYEF